MNNTNNNIPKYILKAIHDRARYADKFNELDLMISQWCDANCGAYNVECTWGYVDTLTNPYECERQTIEEIEKFYSKKDKVKNYGNSNM